MNVRGGIVKLAFVALQTLNRKSVFLFSFQQLQMQLPSASLMAEQREISAQRERAMQTDERSIIMNMDFGQTKASKAVVIPVTVCMKMARTIPANWC